MDGGRGGRHGQVGRGRGQHEQVDSGPAPRRRARGPRRPASMASADTVAPDAPLADARALDDPFVGGVEAGLEVGVGDDLSGRAVPHPVMRLRGPRLAVGLKARRALAITRRPPLPAARRRAPRRRRARRDGREAPPPRRRTGCGPRRLPTVPRRSPTATTLPSSAGAVGTRRRREAPGPGGGAGRRRARRGPPTGEIDDTLGRVEVLTLVGGGVGVPGLAAGDGVRPACRGRREWRRARAWASGRVRRASPVSTPPAPTSTSRVAPMPARVSRLWRQRTGLHSWAESRPGQSSAAGVGAGVDVGDHRDLGRTEGRVRQRFAQPRPGRAP